MGGALRAVSPSIGLRIKPRASESISQLTKSHCARSTLRNALPKDLPGRSSPASAVAATRGRRERGFVSTSISSIRSIAHADCDALGGMPYRSLRRRMKPHSPARSRRCSAPDLRDPRSERGDRLRRQFAALENIASICSASSWAKLRVDSVTRVARGAQQVAADLGSFFDATQEVGSITPLGRPPFSLSATARTRPPVTSPES